VNKVRRFRAMGSLCRQQAAYNPAQSWKLLAEAEFWENLAQAEASSHFIECNTTSSDLPKSADRDGRRMSPRESLIRTSLGR